MTGGIARLVGWVVAVCWVEVEVAGQGVGGAGLVAEVEELGERGVPGRSPEPASGMVPAGATLGGAAGGGLAPRVGGPS